MSSSNNTERVIILDTETTGINQEQGPAHLGHRVIEIGCVELVNRRLTGRDFHAYLNPEMPIDPDAIKVHGITDAMVADKPLFKDIADKFLNFIQGAELVIHNAPFDVGFLDQELVHSQHQTPIDKLCQVTDSLKLARERFRGKRNSLDALCERFGIDNSHRVKHGALLDAEILSDVYLMLTGGQTHFNFQDPIASHANNTDVTHTTLGEKTDFSKLKVIRANAEELDAHQKRLDTIGKITPALWDKD